MIGLESCRGKGMKMRNRTAMICGILFGFAQACQSAESGDTGSVSHQIDKLVEENCAAGGCKTLGRCSDAEFLRRVWLDLAGRTPPLVDAQKIATGTKLDRGAVVQRLFKSPEFSRHWG